MAVALTHADPDHAAGAEAIREELDVPVYVGPGGGRDLPFRVTEVEDGAIIEAGAMALRVVGTPGPRPDHIAFVVEAPDGRPVAVLAGDLDGVRGARAMPGPADDAAWAGSVARLRSAAPDVPWFGGHPPRDLTRPTRGDEGARMTEPTGQTIEGEPWPEARGPHLPDRLTRIPLLVWPFVILAGHPGRRASG